MAFAEKESRHIQKGWLSRILSEAEPKFAPHSKLCQACPLRDMHDDGRQIFRKHIQFSQKLYVTVRIFAATLTATVTPSCDSIHQFGHGLTFQSVAFFPVFSPRLCMIISVAARLDSAQLAVSSRC
jgi:hypothetical protein